jgi:hypothetical protein
LHRLNRRIGIRYQAVDSSNVAHGFLRSKKGSINPPGDIMRYYVVMVCADN